MSECEFDYPFRWPQIYESLLSGDGGRFASAVALLTERDRTLEDHLRNRECQNSAPLSECRFEYPYRWADFAVLLCLGDEDARAAAIAVAELNLRALEDHLWHRPCCSGDPCLFEHPYRWTEIGPELTSGDTPRAQRAVALLDENDRALEDHLRNRSCGSCRTAICSTLDFSGLPDNWHEGAGFGIDSTASYWYGVNFDNVDSNAQIVRWDYPTFDNYTILYEFGPTDYWPIQICVLNDEIFWFNYDGTNTALMSGGDVNGTITPSTVFIGTPVSPYTRYIQQIMPDPVNGEIAVAFEDTDWDGFSATFYTSGLLGITPGGSTRTRWSNTTAYGSYPFGSISGVFYLSAPFLIAADGSAWGRGNDGSGMSVVILNWREQGGTIAYTTEIGSQQLYRPLVNGDMVIPQPPAGPLWQVNADLELLNIDLCPEDSAPSSAIFGGLPVYTSDFDTIAWYHHDVGTSPADAIFHADHPV